MFQVFALFALSVIVFGSDPENVVEAPNMVVRLPEYTSVRYAPPAHFKKSARILFWTPIYSELSHWFWWFHESQMAETCPGLPCEFTIDPDRLNESDAVMFTVYGSSMNLSGDIQSQIPPHRRPHQRYVLFMLESPNLDYSGQQLHKLNGFFNWTMTYRRDSDVYAHFGQVVLSKQPLAQRQAALQRDYAADKTKLVAWYVSHCQTEGRREDYVAELQNHLAVDIYGDCGPLECQPPRSEKCYRKLAEYKFYLSFENVLCRDYISEKFPYALAVDTVPVVFGGADYSKFAPPGSYIDALAYATPKDLANHLLWLDQNPAAYNRYFDWKRGYTAVVRRVEFYVCELCLKLMDPDQPPKTYEDINEWWNVQGQCRAWSSKA